MPRVTASTRIAAPVEKVFALSMALHHWPEFIKGIKKVEVLTDGPVRVGTRFRETRIMHGREATEEMEVTAIEPNRSYTLGCTSCGCQYTSVFQFQPEGNGTLVTLDFEGKPVTFMAKLFTPLGWLMVGVLKKCIQEDLDQLKKHAEGASA